MRKHAAPVGLGAVRQRVPVPVLDHRGTPRDEGEGALGQLAGVWREVEVRPADRLSVRLGHEEPALLGGVEPVRLSEELGDARRRPRRHRVLRPARVQVVLGGVVRVARGDVERAHDLLVVEGRSRVGEAGGDELAGARVLAHDAGLPRDELGGEIRLEPAPGEVVLGEGVPVRAPQLGEVREPVGPVGEAPLAVERLDVAVPLAQVLDERAEHALVVEEVETRLVVDLVADDGGVVGVAGDDGADHALGVEPEGGVGVVDLLACTPRDAFAGPVLGRDLRVGLLQPRRHGVGRCAEDDRDAALVRAVEHGLQPVQVELAVARLPGRPDRLAHADDREACSLHEIEVGPGPVLAVVLRVVGSSEEQAGDRVRGASVHEASSRRDQIEERCFR